VTHCEVRRRTTAHLEQGRSIEMKVLVSVASRHGATREIGATIARVLEVEGLDVDVVDPERVTSVKPYDGIVLGSAVYAGRWLGPARDLVERELAGLRERPVWLMSSGPIGDPPKPEAVPPEAVAIKERIGALDHQVFEGRLERSQLGLAEKVIVSAVHAEYGDFRPWDPVIDWARLIAARLSPTASGVAVGTAGPSA
jgi:menaquinone-dependent protoporphyrinogen oxidase